MSDWELIQQYARDQSEPAFAELVHRHLSWVYSVALRRTGQPQLAEEVPDGTVSEAPLHGPKAIVEQFFVPWLQQFGITPSEAE